MPPLFLAKPALPSTKIFAIVAHFAGDVRLLLSQVDEE
jgi:hypothetical protein